MVLRRFGLDDVPMVLDLATDPYVPMIGTLPPRATEAQAVDWIERNRRRESDGTGYSMAIAVAGTDRAVGAVFLGVRERETGRAEGGYSVAPGDRGQGYAAAALTALTAFAWTLPDLHRVELHIEPWNSGSIRTAEQAGHAREGLLRSHQEIGGKRRDMLLFAAVRHVAQ